MMDEAKFTAAEVAVIVKEAVAVALSHNPAARCRPADSDISADVAARLQQYVGAVIAEGTEAGGPRGPRWQAAIRRLEEVAECLRRGELPDVVKDSRQPLRPPIRLHGSKVV